MVSPLAKPFAIESEGAVPDSAVAAVIGVGVASWLLATVPIAEPSVLKKLSPASTAEAAVSEVALSVWIDEVSALLKFAAVAEGVAPIRKLPVGGGEVLVAVSVMGSW